MSLRVHVYPVINGVRRVMIVPGRSMRLPPVTVQGTSKATVREEAARLVDELSSRANQHRTG